MAKVKNDTSVRHRSKGHVMLKCITLGAADAGKTSILRRHFLGSLPLKRRNPTVGADFYSGKVKNPLYHANNNNNNIYKDYEEILLQMWDTAGRERFVHNSMHNNNKARNKYATALSDVFFQHADAAMLVYDATSSTSFTQLLQWHSDLMEKMKSLAAAAEAEQRSSSSTQQQKQKQPKFPVLIVANKMDIVKRQQRKKGPRKTVNQRHIKGLPTEFYNGKDFHYEYRVLSSSDHDFDDNSIDNSSKEKQKNSSSNRNNNKNKTNIRRREEISTFMSTGNTWTTDGSYLDSVLNTEDSSHPDRDMVLLWCMRNGLHHVEVSALDGTGLTNAMETLVGLALESKIKIHKQQLRLKEEAEQQQEYNSNRINNGVGHDGSGGGYSSNTVLDLHQRYSSNDNECCCFIVPHRHSPSLKRI